MAPPKLPYRSHEVSIENKVQIYEASLNALSTANLRNYIDSQDPADILSRSLGESNEEQKSDAQIEKDFLRLVENLFQSITTKGLFTYEIYDYIINKIEEIVINAKDNSNKKELAESYGLKIGSFISVFHKDYYLDEEIKQKFSLEGNKDNLRTIISKAVLSSLFYIGNQSDSIQSIPKSRYGSIEYKSKLSDDKKKNLSNVACYLNISKKNSQDQSLGDRLKEIDVNQNIASPSKQDPSMSIILLNNDNIRCGTKNSLELSAFFNSISTLEFSKAFPYFNATFVLPSTSKQDATNVFKTATLNQFMFGSRNEDVTKNYDSFEGVIKKADDKIGVETNLAVFATPQTVVNMNEKTGHRDIYDDDDKKLRLTSVHDRTRPFMTFKSFEIDIAPTTGLMSFKSGRISLVLHDRTRMGDIAPFIKPDLFGAFGAEISVEYGWKHGDAGRLNKSGNSINPIGDFLNSSVCLEKYMITNSQFSVTNSGEVEINLAIAMKGPVDIRQTEIVEHTRLTIDRNNYNYASQNYITKVQEIQGKLKISSITPAFNSNIAAAINSYSDSFRGKFVQTKKGTRKTRQFRRIDTLVSNLNKAALTFKSAKKNNDTIEFTAPPKTSLSILQKASGITGLTGNNTSYKINIKEKNVLARDFISLGRAIANISNSIRKIVKFNDKVKSQIDSYVDNLIGGLQDTDLLYDKEINKGYDRLKNNVLLGVNFQKNNYITFGSFLSSLVGTHMTSLKKYDEIQIIFHNVNERSGFCSNFGNPDSNISLSLASLLINKNLLDSYLTDLFERNIRVTVESLISQVISNFILTKDNPCYGMQDFFERKNFKSPVKPRKKKKGEKEKLSVSMTQRLNSFYYGNQIGAYDDEGIFIPPSIQLSFDALSDVLDLDKTICRITVYDRNDNPYQAISNCFNQGENINLNGLKEILRLSTKIDNNKKDLDKYNNIAKNKSNKRNKRKKAIAKQRAQKINETLNNQIGRRKDLLDALLGENGLIESFEVDGKQMFKFKSGKGFIDIKEKTRTLMPTATFASEHTALINASAATINEANLNTVYITNQDRNNTSEINNNIIVDMPLRILPSQASIETFGCPWAGFGQYIFIDFETGTTLDNSYAVTSVKHSLTPGNFKTTLALSYGDVYGKYEGLADGFNRLIAKNDELIRESLEKIAQRKESKNKLAEKHVDDEEKAHSENLNNTETEEIQQQQQTLPPKAVRPSEKVTIEPKRMSRSQKANHKKVVKSVVKKNKPITQQAAVIKEVKEDQTLPGFLIQLTSENIFKFSGSLHNAINFYSNYNVVSKIKNNKTNIFMFNKFNISNEIKTLDSEIRAQINAKRRERKLLTSDDPLDFIKLNIYKKTNNLKSPKSIESFNKLSNYFKKQIILSILFKKDPKLDKSIELLVASPHMPTSFNDPTIPMTIPYNPKTSTKAFKSQVMFLYSKTDQDDVMLSESIEDLRNVKADYAGLTYGGGRLSSIIPDDIGMSKDLYNMFELVVKNKTLDENIVHYIKIDNVGIVLRLQADFTVEEDNSIVNISASNIEYGNGESFTKTINELVSSRNYIKETKLKPDNIYSDAFIVQEAKRESKWYEDGLSFFGIDMFDYEIGISNMFDNEYVNCMSFEHSEDRISKDLLIDKINELITENKFINYLLYQLNLEKAKYVNSIKNIRGKDPKDFIFPCSKSNLKLSYGNEDIVSSYLSNWTAGSDNGINLSVLNVSKFTLEPSVSVPIEGQSNSQKPTNIFLVIVFKDEGPVSFPISAKLQAFTYELMDTYGYSDHWIALIDIIEFCMYYKYTRDFDKGVSAAQYLGITTRHEEFIELASFADEVAKKAKFWVRIASSERKFSEFLEDIYVKADGYEDTEEWKKFTYENKFHNIELIKTRIIHK